MAGGRDKNRARVESLIGPSLDPENLMLTAIRQQRAREAVARLREELSANQRRWLAAFELEVRCDEQGDIDIERAARNMGCSRSEALAALKSIRRILKKLDDCVYV